MSVDYDARDIIRRDQDEAVATMAALGFPVSLTSEILFVDSGASNASDSDDGVHGLTWHTPFATIDFAVGMATAGDGCMIFVAPNHTETITGAAALSVDVSGVSIIGLGIGLNRPKLTYGSSGTTISVSATNCMLMNLNLYANTSTVATGIAVTEGGDGAILKDILFTEKSGTPASEFTTAILLGTATGAATDVTIDGCEYRPEDTTAGNFIATDDACHRLTVKNCIAVGFFGTAAQGGIIDISDTALDESIIDNCILGNFTDAAAAGGCVKAAATSKIVVSNCALANLDPDGLPIDADAGYTPKSGGAEPGNSNTDVVLGSASQFS